MPFAQLALRETMDAGQDATGGDVESAREHSASELVGSDDAGDFLCGGKLPWLRSHSCRFSLGSAP